MTVEEAAAEIRELPALRPRGGGTKLGWSPAGEEGAVDLDTTRLSRILEHNEGDFTAVLEAGVPLVEAQATFGAAGQMLALDPPLGAGDEATIGGIIAAKVIKNVAGYDLGKLFAGSFGTLGLIARVAVRLHPAPARTATVVAETGDPAALGSAALKLAALPLEADCLDADWEGDRGRLTIRFAGTTAVDRAEEAARHVELGETRIDDDDHELWTQQRARQRAPEGTVVKVAGRPTDLPAVIAAARDAGGTVVSRAGLGISYVVGGDVAAIRAAMAPRACTVLDGAARVADPWPAVDPGALKVMERIKARFDPERRFRPGAFVGGL